MPLGHLVLQEDTPIRRRKDGKILWDPSFKMIAEDAPYAFLFNEKYGFYAYRDRVGRKKDTYTFGIGTSYWWIKK